jgi:sensor histidine kinase YesM
LLKCTIWGIISGPFFAIFFSAWSGTDALALLFRSPAPLLWTMATGVVWALTFYIACGLGNVYLRSWISGYPNSIIRPIIVVYNTVACSLAFVVAVSINSRLPGVSMQIPTPVFWRIVIVDGLIGGILALVIGAFVKLRMEVERVQAELRLKEVETARAQARALQSQINPHFFFNTLNTISALIDDDPADAKRIIGRLADMFRYTFGCTHTETVELGQELQFVRDYLAIEQSRFPKRLRIEMPPGPLPDIRVPGLVLQPLVENAVKHGIARRIEGGTVSVHVMQGDTGTRVSVRNTADDHEFVAGADLYREGHALENVRARLRLFTGRQEPLLIAQNTGWTEFSFEI